jgi:hypothetical protein
LDGTIVGINQIVWDTFTNTLYVRSEDSLDEQSRYALIATSRLRDASGAALQPSESFTRFRQTVRGE